MSSKHGEFYYVSLDEEIGRVFLQREPHPLAVSEFLLKPLAEYIVKSANAYPKLVEAVKNNIELIEVIGSEITVRQILDSNKLIELTGINPWCINEGLADGDDIYEIDADGKTLLTELNETGD